MGKVIRFPDRRGKRGGALPRPGETLGEWLQRVPDRDPVAEFLTELGKRPAAEAENKDEDDRES